MALTVLHNGMTKTGSGADLAEYGVPHALIAEAVKTAAKAQAEAMAENFRQRLGAKSAAKLAEYRIKGEIARNPEAATSEELELLTREAAARGTDRKGLLDMIIAQVAAYRRTALLIGALETEIEAAVAAIDNGDKDIEQRAQKVLMTATARAEKEFAEAMKAQEDS